MGIEDIPEMQVVEQKRDVDGEVRWKYKPVDFSLGATGRFIVLEGDKQKTYIYASHDPRDTLQHKDLRDGFDYLTEKQYAKNPSQGFDVLGGGFFDITGDSIRLHSESESYGSYDSKVVRPILERWALQNLPDYGVEVVQSQRDLSE